MVMRMRVCILVPLWVVLVAVRAQKASEPAFGPSIQLDGNTRVALSSFGGFPSGSWTLLMSFKVADVTERPPMNRGTFLSFFSKKLSSTTLTLSNPNNLEIGYGMDAKFSLKSGLNVDDGFWHALILTYDAGTNTFTFYLDGQRAFFTQIKGYAPGQEQIFFAGLGTLVFGQRQKCDEGCFDSDGGFYGRLRQVALLNTAFSWKDVATMNGTTALSPSQLRLPQVVFAYKLSEGSGLTAVDSGTRRLTGSLGNTPVVAVTGSTAKAFYLTGSTHVFRRFKYEFPRTNVTLIFKVKVTSPKEEDVTIASYSSEDDPMEFVLHNPAALQIRYGSSEFSSMASIADSQWHTVAVVIGSNPYLLSLVVDGKSVFTATTAELAFSRSGRLVLGQLQTCYGGCFDDDKAMAGFIQEVHILNRTSTVAEISAFTSTDTRSLFLSWIAKNALGLEVTDGSTNGRTGFLGAPRWIPACPNQCSSPNGYCDVSTGRCVCAFGVRGDDCSIGCPNKCSGRGTCVQGKCVCFPMFEGRDCSSSSFLSLQTPVLCSSLAPAISVGAFCEDMLNKNASYPSAVMERTTFSSQDNAARVAYERVASTCGHPYGLKMLKAMICGTFFQPCTAQGVPQKPCVSDCLRTLKFCPLDSGLCTLAMFGNATKGEYCTTAKPADDIVDCPYRCRGHGNCVAATCKCDPGWQGLDCGSYIGDAGTTFTATRRQPFCDMVRYSVPKLINVTWADKAAKEAYSMLSPFCSTSKTGLDKMKTALCATSHLKLENGVTQRPCRSLCQAYAADCGFANNMCYGSFYADYPNCFQMKTSEEQAAEDRIPPCTNATICVHGSCFRGSCICSRGWHGPTCNISLPTCVGYCSGHGVCQDGLCKCLPGWMGEDCATQIPGFCQHDCLDDGKRGEDCCKTPQDLFDIPWPFQLNEQARECAIQCSGHGNCDNSTYCKCMPGWAGKNCSQSVQYGCLRNCSMNGDCVAVSDATSDAYCLCRDGWVGVDCSQPAPCPYDCHGQGKCDKGACICYEGYVGTACQIRVPKCPHEMVCKNGGQCFEGRCACTASYAGLDCRNRLRCPVDFNCINGGVCQDNGMCKCPVLWQGHDCSQMEHPVVKVNGTLPARNKLTSPTKSAPFSPRTLPGVPN